MPGSIPYMNATPVGSVSGRGSTASTGTGTPAAAAMVPNLAGGFGGVETKFLVWLVLIGVVLPVAILGGLKVGKFQFVYRR